MRLSFAAIGMGASLLAGIVPAYADIDSVNLYLARKLALERRGPIDHVYVNGELVLDTPEYRVAHADPELRARVIAYFDQIFIHGVPYDEAITLGPHALSLLESMIQIDSLSSWRPAMVPTIAYLGGHRGAKVLEGFTWGTYGEVDLSTFEALTSTNSVIGFSQWPEMVDYLVRGTNPESWKKIGWTYGSYRDEKLWVLLSKTAINGLGLTGTPRAAEVLEKLATSPHAPEQVSNIREAMARNEAVMKMGVVEYLRELQSKGTFAPRDRTR